MEGRWYLMVKTITSTVDSLNIRKRLNENPNDEKVMLARRGEFKFNDKFYFKL